MIATAAMPVIATASMTTAPVMTSNKSATINAHSAPVIGTSYPNRTSMISATPMIAISHITAITDESLATMASVRSIPRSVNIMTYPWAWLIYHNFIAMIHIITTISRGQIRPVHPSATA